MSVRVSRLNRAQQEAVERKKALDFQMSGYGNPTLHMACGFTWLEYPNAGNRVSFLQPDLVHPVQLSEEEEKAFEEGVDDVTMF